MKIHHDTPSNSVLEENESFSSFQIPRMQKFQDFRRHGMSLLLILIFNLIFTFGYCIYYFLEQSSFTNSIAKSYPHLYLCQLSFLFVSIITTWIVFYSFLTKNSKLLSIRYHVKSLFLITLTIFFSLQFMTDIFQFAQEGIFQHFLTKYPSVATYPVNSLILLILIPVNTAEIFRETNIYILSCQWIIIFISLIIATIVSPSANSILILLTFCTMKLLVLLDRSYFTWTIFEETQKLEKKIGNYTRNALERKVMEMRDMIGNVAHDLKTPLTSFMTATEMIQMDMKSCQENLRSLLSEVPDNDLSNNAVGILKTRILTLFEELSSDVVCSISSIKDIQLFMLMMINRSIDFKKASKGIELTPMKEMVNLSEAISMPVQCMINLQNKIKIHVNEIPDSIHGYIKTDKQWLQENLLCVLSNAVKHSTGGTVKLTLSLKGKKSLRNPGTVHREVIARHSIASVNERKVSSMLPLDVNRATPATSRNQSVEFPFQQLSTITSVWVSALKQETRAPSKYWEPIEPTGDKDLYLLFEIEDNGVGLSADELVTFFNPFKQKRLSGGTGLGLYALAKRIEALGGQYGVRVREDGFAGSVVWFTIPYQPDQIQSERDSSDHPSIAAGATVDKKPIHSDLLNDATSRSSIEPSISPPDSQSLKRAVVLIVEDAPAIAKMTCKMLNRLNIDAEIAENGQIALEKIIKSYEKNDGPKTRYDAILMDFQMPVMDGIEATAKIREYEKMHDITESRPIIGISAISDTEVIDQGLKSGMNGFIPKPFSSDDFLNHLKKSTDS